MDGPVPSGTLILLLLPIVLINLGLLFLALRDLKNRKRVKGGNKLVWALVILLIEFIGPIAYLVYGREEG